MERLKKYPVLSSLAFTMVITIVLCLRTKQNMLETLAIGAVVGLICFYPFVLTVFCEEPERDGKTGSSAS